VHGEDEMAIYALWNNKGGVGKSYLTFQIASEYARTHPAQKVLVIDLCPQANASGMLLGGIVKGEEYLNSISGKAPRLTISGYVEERLASPYISPNVGSAYIKKVRDFNKNIPDNLFLVVGDEQLEVQASRVSRATQPGPADAWRIVHGWISDLIADVRKSWNVSDSTVFIDCNPSFSIYTELAMAATERLIIPFSADGSSKRAVRAVLSLVYGVTRMPGSTKSEFFTETERVRMKTPKIYCYVGNRMTQSDYSSAAAFKAVVNEIGKEIYNVFRANSGIFQLHPNGSTAIPHNSAEFGKMFQSEIKDSNTASVVSSALGIPIIILTAGNKIMPGKRVIVNQTQLNVLLPNMRKFVASIE
jgi:chromosome partitioning protein